jgi:hypothetical protein
MDWLNSHGVGLLIGYYFFSAFSGGMPTPPDNSSIGYRWFFSSMQILNASWARLAATQFPASKIGQSLTGNPPVQPVVVASVNEPQSKP